MLERTQVLPKPELPDVTGLLAAYFWNRTHDP